MTPILICMVGLPRSGKSTWAKEQGYPVVCPDEIRLALHGHRFISLAEPFVWAIAEVMVRALFGAGHERVILDATNTTRAARNRWQGKDDDHGNAEWETYFKVISTSKEVCIGRAVLAEDSYIIPVIERQAGQWEELDTYEIEWYITGNRSELP